VIGTVCSKKQEYNKTEIPGRASSQNSDLLKVKPSAEEGK